MIEKINNQQSPIGQTFLITTLGENPFLKQETGNFVKFIVIGNYYKKTYYTKRHNIGEVEPYQIFWKIVVFIIAVMPMPKFN